jgi:hypothetical protein
MYPAQNNFTTCEFILKYKNSVDSFSTELQTGLKIEKLYPTTIIMNGTVFLADGC